MAKRASWHESGHAICARILNFDFGGAAINLDGTGHAAVGSVVSLHWDPTHMNIMSSVVDKITVCWAGPLAEDIKFGGADDRGDRKQIEHLAAKYYVSDSDVAAARERARELLIKHWDAVEAVAAALLEKRTLSGEDIDALLVLLNWRPTER